SCGSAARRRSTSPPAADLVSGDRSDPLLEVTDISMDFGGVRALQRVTFRVCRAEVFSIIGPNGAGKTSMLNVISGVYRPTGGRIRFEGRDRTRLGPQALAGLGIARDRKSTRLNSSHVSISYAV